MAPPPLSIAANRSPDVDGSGALTVPTEPADRILVVDDDPFVTGMVSTALKRVGYRVATSDNGESAWDALRAEAFDLLLTDYSMPRLNGLELLQRLRQSSLQLPAILMSAGMSRDLGEIIAVVSPGGALHKPFGLDELYFKVGSVLDHARPEPPRDAGGAGTGPRALARRKREILEQSAGSRRSALAEKLLQLEAETVGGGGAHRLARVCAKMSDYLVNLAGVIGFRALLVQAVADSRSEVAWLRHLKVSERGSLEAAFDGVGDLPAAEIRRGEVAVLARILGSLTSYLGDSLVRSCLAEVWREPL